MRRRRVQRALLPAHADRDRLLAEEVLYLHSLWRRGPEVSAPAPAPAPIPPPGSGSAATRRVAARRRRRRLERRVQEGKGQKEEGQESGPEWPLAPSPPTSPTAWHGEVYSSLEQRPPPQQRQHSPRSLSQQAALRAAEAFFSNRGGSDGDDEEGSEPEGEEEEEEETAAGFFMGLFERDAALRGFYERSWEGGEFRCMACVGRKGKARRFTGCVGLVQHARAATRCGRPRAQRALAATICRVLGWDIERLPSVVIDPRGTLGQALASRAAAAAIQENTDAGERGISSEGDEAEKVQEDDGTGKCDVSLNNVDAINNANVRKGSSSINDDNGEVN
ncbi:uncharacterized protein LOC102700250 isoform X3 [Oryza brachyantha]|uniref:uncharacterized protein LOC102700250 isoform X3 n=1 Tax=Oryza brachyantha TaxID=4533 RepID=UPI001ADB1378|nr:uncharacterized protein LOC102700250 isoform X3 [Oryza brachyantha]